MQVPFPPKGNEIDTDHSATQKTKNLNSGVQGKHIDFSPRLLPDGSKKQSSQEITLASEKVILHYLETAQVRKNGSLSEMQIRPKY